MIEISILHNNGQESYWTNEKVLGMCERQNEGRPDGKVDVFFPEHRKNWDVAYGATYGFSPEGQPQTMRVLKSDEVRYICEISS